ncbi:MAG: bifunctional [glutamate--ammonia ligase]-adenylyl-L-tyrosine phosphorylase/[glutamate--ammonia-ligase] adenylyltransferase [Desulfobacterales bacterium]|nr:bifunctional [glutamate--ammonia ligase]-adenylyl-L-tyrosine phosphorylase/[glutamate--ammonia-ligase] adenylyltransferase [Desulfobacterales bacterium]
MLKAEERSRHHIPPLSGELEKAGEESWAAFSQASQKAGIAEPASKTVRQVLTRAFSLSDFVFRSALHSPDQVDDLIRSEDLFRKYGVDLYQEKIHHCLAGASGIEEIARRLRQKRLREMVRIICRDLSGLADLKETMEDLSRFAEACIEQALEPLYRHHADQWGTPCTKDGAAQHLVVIGMGKLGALELNLSSDIDLIFAYPENGTTHGGKRTTNEDFFTRLCRSLIQVIGATTSEGFVFRVDARLRPYGENGPLAMSFDAMEDYYQNQGREWERYAWIKARVVTGDPEAGEALMARMAPFVYRRYLDYGAIDALRGMKQKIAMEVRRKKIQDNVKLGAGGIREIEFFGQVFQLMRGGVVPALRQRSIESVLKTLADENDIDHGVCRDLTHAYRFLRNTENRIQAWADQQTHDLPKNAHKRACLAAAMGFDRWDDFLATLDGHRRRVHDHFSGLLETGSSAEDEGTTDQEIVLAEIWQDGCNGEKGRSILAGMRFVDPESVCRDLANLRSDPATRALSRNGRQRLDRLIPCLMEAVKASNEPDAALRRLLDLIRTVQQRTNYLALLLENPSALTHLVRFADISPWIVTFLSRHPVLLDELLDPRTLYTPPGRSELEAAIERRLARIDADDLEYQIETLCIFRQVNILRVAAADITGALTLMRTSDHLTEIAETIVGAVLELAWRHLTQKHGLPECFLDQTPCSRGFAVIAYGKMGGLELGYGSDLDLVFLHAGKAGDTAGGQRPIDNAQFFSRLGQRVVHILTAHTRAGRLYEADMRLRPSGSGGILVSHVDAFDSYQTREAWTWEHQALVRARAVAGEPTLMKRFEETRHRTLSRPRDPRVLRQEVTEMREKMRQALYRPEKETFDLKQGNGGMVDIEFIVQYLILCHANRHPELTRWSDNVRQMESLMSTGVLEEETAQLLRKAYLAYRAAVHRLNLQERPSRVPRDRFEDMPRRIAGVWKAIFG